MVWDIYIGGKWLVIIPHEGSGEAKNHLVISLIHW